jgi:hypothetical protein
VAIEKELNLTWHENAESMVKVCDVVTINAPLHPETENMFNATPRRRRAPKQRREPVKHRLNLRTRPGIYAPARLWKSFGERLL